MFGGRQGEELGSVLNMPLRFKRDRPNPFPVTQFITVADQDENPGGKTQTYSFALKSGQDAEITNRRLLGIIDVLGQEQPQYAAQLSVLAQSVTA